MPARSALAMGADNSAPAFRAGDPAAVEVRRAPLHVGRQLNAFNGTDLREALAADDKAGLSAPLLRWRASFLHGGIIPQPGPDWHEKNHHRRSRIRLAHRAALPDGGLA